MRIEGIRLNETLQELVALNFFLEEDRDEQVENVLTFSTITYEKMEIPKYTLTKWKQNNFKKLITEEEVKDEALTLKQALRRFMFQLIVKFDQDLKTSAE